MNYSFFLIGTLLLVLVPSLAFAETITGQNYFDVENADGTRTWTTHEPYVFDGNSWVPYIKTGNTIHTDLASVTLNSDGSYTWNGKFSDRIVAKYSDVSDQVNWTYPNTLNNDTPDISWDGSAFVSSKVKSGVGQLDYKYVLTSGKWKTQLEATNLSSLNTKVFGFDQIVDLQSDSIKFNGITRNLDNFNGTTFDKEYLDANKGKVIDLLTGVNFDFDLGYENLYSITVYDTGVNKSRLVFDYRTTEILLPGETLIIDPTFGYTVASTERRINNPSATGAACSSTGTYANYGGTEFAFIPDSDDNAFCSRTTLEWDISSITDGSTITNVNLKYDVTGAPYTIRNCDFTGMSVSQPSTSGSPRDLWNNISNSTVYVDNTSSCTTVANDKVLDLGASADSELQAKLTANWFAIGIKLDNESRDSANNYGQLESGGQWELEVTYTLAVPQFEVDNLIIENIGDAFSSSGNVTINSGNLVNVTSIVYSVNGTTITTNSTIQNTTSYPTTINFGPFFYQQTTDSAYNHTVTVNVQSNHISSSNSSFSVLTREYDPDYFTAIDPSQGTVNYTFIGTNTINVNRDTGGLPFSIECQYFTQAQAFSNDLNSATWDNFTNVIFYEGDTSGYYYIQCFNDGELFVVGINQSFSNALVPGLLIFDQLGGFFGAPSIILVILSILSLGTGRNYPIIMLIAASVTGILLALELLTLDPGLVVALIVMTGFGLFGIRKFY